MYFDHNNTSVAFPIKVHQVIENVCTRSTFNFLISKSFDRLKTEPTPILLESNISLSGMEVLSIGIGNSILQTCYQTKKLTCLKVDQDRASCIIAKRGDKSWAAVAFHEKFIPYLQGVNFVLGFSLNLFSEGLEYRTNKEPAISAFHEKVEGIHRLKRNTAFHKLYKTT